MTSTSGCWTVPVDYAFFLQWHSSAGADPVHTVCICPEGKRMESPGADASVLAYNYGTMLLLCGPTYRFFHFDSVIFVPLCLLLFSRTGEKEGEQKTV